MNEMQVVSIDRLALTKQPPVPDPDKLDYTYTYQYQCRNCVTYNGSTTCEAPFNVTSDPRSRQAPPAAGVGIGAPDLAIVAQTSTAGGQTAQQKFLAILEDGPPGSAPGFRGFLNGMRASMKGNLDDTDHQYETLDADSDPPHEPDGAGAKEFISHSSPYLFDPATGKWDGQNALEYFLLQVKSFYDQLQSVLGAPPAKDGRLPNPLQPINDPIRGDTHAVDGRYEWQDSQGNHAVTVEIGPFIKASMSRPFHTGTFLVGHQCVEMIDGCDNTAGCAYQGPDRTWVRITRQDPTNQQTGLWRWNPFGGTIRKTARTSYNHLFVGICGTSGGDCP